MSAEPRTVGDRRDTVGIDARAVAGDTVTDRLCIRHGLVKHRLMRPRHNFDQRLAFGNFISGRREIEIDAGIENIGFTFAHALANLFQVALDRQRHGAGQHLDDDKNIRCRAGAGLEGIAAVDGADLHGWQHELVWIFALVIFFPVLNRLRHLAGRENEFRRFAVDADPRPEQAGIADLQLQSCRLSDNAHVRHHAMIHQVAGTDTGAAISFTLKATDLRLFDLAHDAGNDQISLELDPGPLQRRHRLDVTRKRRLHVDQAAAVDAVLVNDRLLRIVEMVHVRVEH